LCDSQLSANNVHCGCIADVEEKAMKICALLTASFCLLFASSLAHGVGGGVSAARGKAPQDQKEQGGRRAELRAALRAQQQNAVQDHNGPRVDRKLTDGERSELRQQVRQQRHDGNSP